MCIEANGYVLFLSSGGLPTTALPQRYAFIRRLHDGLVFFYSTGNNKGNFCWEEESGYNWSY